MPNFLLNSLQCIPQRWIIAAMGFFAFFNTYTLRICLSMAITQMVVPLNKTEVIIRDETCPSNEEQVLKNSTASSGAGGTFEWSEYTQGIILSSFYWGYVVTHLPGGLLSEKFGPKYTIGIGALIAALLNILTPAATHWGDANALIFVRFLLGLCCGVIQPAISCLLAHWIPAHERSTISAIVYTGIRLGIFLSQVLSGLIMRKSSSDWPYVFYLFGALALLWLVFWALLCYDNPRSHPFITSKEKAYLQEHMSNHTHEKAPAFPWRHALTSKPFLALVFMQSGFDWSNYIIMSDLPKYMQNVLKLPIHLIGLASSGYLIGSWLFCMFMSWLSDLLILKGRMTTTKIRKMNVLISSFGASALMLLALYVGCDIISAVSLITIGLTLSGATVPGIKVNVLDLSPNYAGTLMGISNGIGAFAGIVAPYSVGVLAPNQTLSEWRLIFWIVAGVYFVTTTNFMVFASGEVQEWNDPGFLTGQQDRPENINLMSVKQVTTSN